MFKKKVTPPSIEAEFDIERLDVYAIDRCPQDGDTCIRYFDDEKSACRALITTTDDQHRNFIARFRAKLEVKMQRNDSKVI